MKWNNANTVAGYFWKAGIIGLKLIKKFVSLNKRETKTKEINMTQNKYTAKPNKLEDNLDDDLLSMGYTQHATDFIVRAVNSHDLLVAACKDALVMLCDLADEVSQDNYGLLDRFREAKNTVEEALKQAEEA